MLTYDDAVLFASGQDGSLFVFDVKDKDPTRVVTKRCVHPSILHLHLNYMQILQI